MTNSVDPDEMAHSGPFHVDLHCLHSIFWSTRLKGLKHLKIFSCNFVQSRKEGNDQESINYPTPPIKETQT